MSETVFWVVTLTVLSAIGIPIQISWNKTLKETKARKYQYDPDAHERIWAAKKAEFERTQAAELEKAQKLSKMTPDARELYLQNEKLILQNEKVIANQEQALRLETEALRLAQQQNNIAGMILGNEIRNKHHRHHR
jgi:hypothetical protein